MNAKKDRLCNLLIIVLIIIITGLMICTNLFHYCYKMNADIASEAVLARLIWESGEWLPKSWYPSTELRIWSTPNLASLFYGMMHDMSAAMGISCVIMIFGILASAYFFISQFSFKKTHKLFFLLLCLIIPNHFTVLELFYLFGAYYSVHVIVMFLTLGNYARWIGKKTVHIIWLSTMILLSFMLGMQGVREVLVLNFPLFAIELLRQMYLIYRKIWHKKDLTVFIWCMMMLLAGFVGTLLPFSVGQEMRRNIRKGPEKFFQTVLPDVKDCLGLTNIELSGRILCFVLFAVAIIIFICYVLQLCRKQYNDYDIWIYFMFWMSTVITVLAVSFTTIASSQRYYFMAFFAMAFGCTCFIKYANEKSKILTITGYAMVFFLFVFQLHTIYLPIMRNDESISSEEYQVCNFLEESKYEIAYADFETANTMTILSGETVRKLGCSQHEKMVNTSG